jgi:hypothetical protein
MDSDEGIDLFLGIIPTMIFVVIVYMVVVVIVSLLEIV